VILIMGMPGAGKSVQSQLVQDKLGFHWLSTGQLFRETRDPEIKEIMDSGGLVNDGHVSKMVGAKLKEVGYDSTFLLDGYPRTIPQAEWLLSHGEEIEKHIKLVLYLVVSDKTAMERLGDRGRPDDSARAIAQRQKEAEKIVPTIERLREGGVPVEEIDANGTVEEIFENIKHTIARYI
jgi:adenylate kinase